jgi:hypothetical protein
MNRIKRNPCEEFNNQMWLYVDKLLNKKEMLIWSNHLENCETCNKLLSDSLEAINSYDGIPLEDLSDRDYQRLINKAVTNTITNTNNTIKTIKIPERRSLLEIIGIYRLTFGGAVVVGALIFLLITFIKDPKIPRINNEIPRHFLSWDNERVSERLSNIEDQIISLKIDDWDIYLIKDNRKEKWSNEVRSIQKQIRKMKKQADSPAM